MKTSTSRALHPTSHEPTPLFAAGARRAAGQRVRAVASDPLVGGAVFAIEQLEVHARELAATHGLGPHRRSSRLLAQLSASGRILSRCNDDLSAAHVAGRPLTPAAEWLFDNHYLIEEQVVLTRSHFPVGYCRGLPRLAGGDPPGMPRIYDFVHEFVAHVDGRLDDEALARYTAAYQSVTNLTMGELWAVPIMLRLVLVENLRRLATSTNRQREDREEALAWAKRIDAPTDEHESTLLVLADMVRSNPPLSSAFVAQFTRALEGRGATTNLVLAWLEQRLDEGGQTIEDVVRAENQRQAADQASMANSIASLKFVDETEWYSFVEANSATEAILRGEAAGVYGRMDVGTRDEYRHVVESVAKQLHLDEETVARTAVEMAAAHYAERTIDATAHVGYMLVDQGRYHLLRKLRGQPDKAPPSKRAVRSLELLGYLGPVALLSAGATLWLYAQFWQASGFSLALLMIWSILAASHCAVALVNWAASHARKPRALPRMDFEHGIPDEFRTIAVVPTLLLAPKRIGSMVEALELRFLANRDPNLLFGLLTDFGDAAQEHVEGDEAMLQLASAGIEKLNEKYGAGDRGRFFLFHRPRLYNSQEGCWMGRERKRGKLEDFNALLCVNEGKHFSLILGDRALLSSIRYVITLDTDTDLPWGAGWRLVGAAAHPLNRPTIDPSGQHLICGYAILQPRVSTSVRSADQSYYSRLLAGEIGFDPYTRLVSDVYQDLFSETSFIGKGIYDVSAFRQLLEGRFPDNAVLSHDLLESCYARSGQCSDVELLEDTPSGYLADVSRRHRWMRGDWQIAPWLGLRVSDASGRRIYPAIAALGRWKIFDNLRRSLVAPAFALLLAVGWFVVPNPISWTLAVLALAFLPELLPGLLEVWQRPAKQSPKHHMANVMGSTARRLSKMGLYLAFIPFEAYVALDASFRSLWRMLYSRKRLLEWQTAAAVERAVTAGIMPVIRRMWVGPTVSAAVVAMLLITGSAPVLLAAGPLLLIWFLSPLVAWWVSRPRLPEPGLSGPQDVLFLRRVARLTWRYFEVFTGPADNWLPPDNVQELPDPRVAHRTSPTDMGLALLANLSAHDLGYISHGELLERTTRTVESMEQLERHRGHFLNWYDTQTRKALRPLYVSAVDSGNLVGHVKVLGNGLLDMANGPPVPAGLYQGLRDTLQILTDQTERSTAVQSANWLFEANPPLITSRAAWLKALAEVATNLVGSIDSERHAEASWWAHAFERQVEGFQRDLADFAPWASVDPDSFEGEAKRWLQELDRAGSLRGLAEQARGAAQALSSVDMTPQVEYLVESFLLGAQNVDSRIASFEALAARCLDFADADFSFLYNRKRKLLSLGYWVAERRLDHSHYDLLASEARLASYVAIASGQIPYEHWFALGRRMTTVRGTQLLLSWSGSMFEYLMPLLVMPAYRNTLLDQTCSAAVARQIEYGKQRNIPWGISESCYNVTDGEGTYQYRAFGVPGLGFQRGLGDDLVVAPYASTLALLVDPRSACSNLRRLQADKCLGPFGFYEAIDFTAPRAREGGQPTIIPTVMAHHHGMSLLALSHALLGPLMQRRFLRNPNLRAAALLLQERVPKAVAIVHPHAGEVRASLRGKSLPATATMRVYSRPDTHAPEVQLLSNGRYHVMVSAVGGGYSRCNELSLTRWRADPTSESLGVFCYVGDGLSHNCWSNSFQPMLFGGHDYEAIFTSGRAEFRRQDAQIETHTEIAVSAEDDLEVRRLTLTNRSESVRPLWMTSYAEVVLAPGISDELHRAFSNLFVHTEILPEQGAVLMTRRKREKGEQAPWMFCLLLANGEQVGECSFETDRNLFIGRGRTLRNPAVLQQWGPLSGSVGAVLDPCVAIRRKVVLAAEAKVQFDLILGAAPTREAAVALVTKYQDRRMADRVLEAAAPHSRAILNHLGATEAEAHRYTQMASAVLFPNIACRASRSMLRRNRKGQSGLWAYALSGDLPIVLLRVTDRKGSQVVHDLLKAHAYWRSRGLLTDLVIWNEGSSGYRSDVGEWLQGLIAGGTEAHLIDKPGGVFLRNLDRFPEEDRVLLLSAAHFVVRDVDGPLEHQMARWRGSALPPPAPPIAAPMAQELQPWTPPLDLATRGLTFFNGIGGFTQDGKEYVMELAPGRQTPAPWVNVIANPGFGTVVSESGSAYTWFKNSQLFRLTPWENDSVTDPSGEVLYVRDDASGRYFSPMAWPHAGTSGYTCRHGFGYSVFEHAQDELKTELTTFVSVTSPVKFLVLKIRNTGPRSRALSLFASFDLVLGDLRSKHAMHTETELEPLTGAILARNRFSGEFPHSVAFFDCSTTPSSLTGDRAEFLGRNGTASNPAAMHLTQLSGRLGPGLDPCAAMQVSVELLAGQEREFSFIMGAGDSTEEATSLVRNHRGLAAARVAQKEVWRFWNDKLGVIHVETPDPALDIMVNSWLPYQVLSCRLWGRSGFYQSGGAFGFRDQLQDSLALLHEVPEVCRQLLLSCARQQFEEGDVLHWWHPPGGRGVRTRCSDDYLWLPYAVARYVAFTGDAAVLDERLTYLTGRALNEAEESYYDLPGRSEQSGTLYEHCTRALLKALRFGAHGLPLMGSGDWNDGMNRVGRLGQGESVWLAFFLGHVLAQFGALATLRGDTAFADQCAASAGKLVHPLKNQGWDGHWYRRGYFDSGAPLGSALNEECRIDSLPQSWATISGMGDPMQRKEALDSVWSHLVREDLGLVQLLTPPFDGGDSDPGYIQGYPPGVRENGGQYTHAAVWTAFAFALAGRSQQTEALVSMLNPINHARSPEEVQRYKVEPYVLSADVYSQPPFEGRGGWSWYTGSAAWYYRLLHEVIFGMTREGDTLRFQPRVPASWKQFKLHYRVGQTFYHVVFIQEPDHQGPPRLELDNQGLPDNTLRIVDDGQDHDVRLLFGASKEPGQTDGLVPRSP